MAKQNQRLSGSQQSAVDPGVDTLVVDISATDYTPPTTGRYLYVGVAGDVVLTLVEGSAPVTFKAMPVGLYALAVKLVTRTGTTATNMVIVL